MVARSLIARTARFSLFSLCFVTTDFVARGSTIVQQSPHASVQSSSLSSLVDKIQASGKDPLLSGLATNRVGSGFKILKSPSASGLHQLCADFDLNASASVEAAEDAADEPCDAVDAPQPCGFSHDSEALPCAGNADVSAPRRSTQRPPCLDAADPACIPVDLARPLKQVRPVASSVHPSLIPCCRSRGKDGPRPLRYSIPRQSRTVVDSLKPVGSSSRAVRAGSPLKKIRRLATAVLPARRPLTSH
jgi:hypothetical protein